MTDAYTGPGERITITEETDPVKRERHVARYERAVAAASEIVGKGKRWLDCACGTGYGAEIVAPHEPDEYLGVDNDRDAIGHASVTYNFADDDPAMDVWFHQADIRHAIDGPYGGWLRFLGTFDVILSIETLEHLTRQEQHQWCLDAAGSLRPGGVFVISCPIGDDGPSKYNRYHLHEPSEEGLRAMLGVCFRSVELDTENYVDFDGRKAVQAFAVCQP